MRNGILAIYDESGDGRTFLLATSESPHLLKLASREVLQDLPPPISALDRARVAALRAMAEIA
jgi:hypothetical protein